MFESIVKGIFQAQAEASRRGVVDISEALEPTDSSADDSMQWAKKIYDRLQSARQEMAKVIALLHPAIEDPHAEARVAIAAVVQSKTFGRNLHGCDICSLKAALQEGGTSM